MQRAAGATRIARWLCFAGRRRRRPAAARVVEIPDGNPAPRPRALLVAIERGEAPDGVGRVESNHSELAARAPGAQEIDLRRGNPARQCQAVVGRAGDGARQGLDLAGCSGIMQRRKIQAMAARIPCDARFAGGGARPCAGASIAAVGVDPARANCPPPVLRSRRIGSGVMAGVVPAIHVLLAAHTA